MKLFPRTLVIISITFIILILVLNTIIFSALDENLHRYEVNSAIEDIERVESTIQREKDLMQSQAMDNSHWTILYEYVQHPVSKFIEIYFSAGTFQYMNLNFVLVYDLNQTLLDYGAYDFQTKELSDVPSTLIDLVNGSRDLITHEYEWDNHQRIVRLGEQNAMLASSPILTTEEEGPIMGSMLMGRYLDDIEMARVAMIADVDLDFIDFEDAHLSEDFIDAMADPSLESLNISHNFPDPNTISVYAPIRADNGSILMLLRVSEDRATYNQGMVAYHLLNITLLAVLITDGVALLYLLRRYVLKPVSHLNSEMRRIGDSGDLSARVEIAQHEDEIAELTGTFNQMVEQLELKDIGLKETEQRYRDIIETSTDWIWQTDDTWHFTFSNSISTAQLGFRPEELRERTLFDLVDAIERSEIEARVSASVKEKCPLRGLIFTMVAKSGKTVIFEMNAQPMFDSVGKWQGLRGVARDITDLVRNEKALEKSNKQLTLLSSITRHDILNQATILSGYAELLREGVKEPEQLKHIEKQQKAIDTVVRQIKFTGIYQQLGTQEPVWHDITRLLDSAIRQLDLRGLNVEADIGPTEVLADPILEKVFYNLIENVVRHSGATFLKVFAREGRSGLIITFEDNGRGVPHEMKERIFARGYGQNSGLGLFLVREVLNTTKMTIIEDGEPGRGARFIISIPSDHWRTMGEGKE